MTRLGDLYSALEAGDTAAALHAQAARLESELLLTPRSRKAAYVALPGEEPELEPPRQKAADRMRLIDPDEAT